MSQNQYAYEQEERLIAEAKAAIATTMRKVYGWMTAGLMITAVCAMGVATIPTAVQFVYATPGVWIGCAIATFGLVLLLSWGINKISPAIASLAFIVYSALMGVTLSWVFMVYTLPSIYTTFFICAAMFGAMSVYGFLTQRDLSSLGSILFMALIGLILASVVNFFWANSTLYWIVTYAGVIIFVGLTAYDTQKIKESCVSCMGNAVALKKLSIVGALSLYLDFINLMLYLLRIFGSRK